VQLVGTPRDLHIVDDLAVKVGLRASSLNRHFRAATSMSPLQYQKQIRLQHGTGGVS
jgi:transcriptional regulator GlxA family with amidase domain